MGLFGSKKKIYVSSSVNKIVDDGAPRSTFMQEAIVSSTLLGDPKASVSDSILNAHLQGPRTRLRNMFTWAKANYDYAIPSARIDYNEVIDNDAVAAQILSEVYFDAAGTTISVTETFIDTADEAYYAEHFIFENRPELAGVDWAADFDASSGDIWIQYPNGTEYPLGTPISSEAFTPSGFNSSNRVLVAYYNRTDGSGSHPTRVFIYVIGSGNSALDNYSSTLPVGEPKEFYPVLPIRIDNVSVFDGGSPALTKEDDIRKAYKKAFGGDIDELIGEIDANENVGDIDYAYMVFGCSLNTKSKWEKQYIFDFFRSLADYQGTGSTAYSEYQQANNANGYQEETYRDGSFNINVGAASTATTSQNLQVNTLRLTLPGSSFLGNFDMSITWGDISETRHTGVIEQNAKPGDTILTTGGQYQRRVDQELLNAIRVSTSTVDEIIIKKQISKTEYIELVIKGLEHKNLIYQGKSVDITGAEALLDNEPSGFVIPLHEPTLRAMGIVRATEIARESFILVFNSYQVVKQKWYQTGLFKFILAVVIAIVVAIITVVTAGTGTGPAAAGGAGLLGTAASVGAFLGFQGLLAVAIGAAVNAIAAMIVVQLISVVATQLFGERIGRIIASVAAVAISFGMGPNGFSVSNFSTNIANIGTIDKLAALTSATADIASIIQQGKIEDIQIEIAQLEEDYQDEMDRLKEQWETFGFGTNIFDPLMLTDFSDPLSQMGENFTPMSFLGESTDEFIGRTLMTGSDLIDLSQAMVSDFVDATLTLP